MSNYGICLDPNVYNGPENLTCDLTKEAYQTLLNSSEPSQDYFVANAAKSSEANLSLSQFHKQIHEGAFKGHSSAPAKSFWQGNPWAYSGLALFPAACKGKSKGSITPVSTPKAKISSDWNIKSKGIRKVRVDLEGDPKLGTILFIRQAHLPHALLQYINENREGAIRVGQYQMEMLRLLELVGPKHIFTESNAYDISPKQIHHSRGFVAGAPFKHRMKTKAVFTQEVLDNPNDSHLILAAIARADLVYALRHKDIYLHKTANLSEAGDAKECDRTLDEHWVEVPGQKIIDPQTSNKIVVREMVHDLEHPEVKEVCFHRRERSATREIINYLRAHPGEKVVLIYGAAHEFADDFKRAGFQPRMVSVWWEIPGIYLHSNLKRK